MGTALPVISAVASVIGVGVSVASAISAKNRAKAQAKNEKAIATIENARSKAAPYREGRARRADIAVAAAAGGTLGTSTVQQGRQAISTNIAREKRDIDKLTRLGATAIEARRAGISGAASEAAASSVIQGVTNLSQNSFIQGLFEQKPAAVPGVA